ncbi:MAG: hypothetical protein R3Y18_00090 [Bacillota bacterium]
MKETILNITFSDIFAIVELVAVIVLTSMLTGKIRMLNHKESKILSLKRLCERQGKEMRLLQHQIKQKAFREFYVIKVLDNLVWFQTSEGFTCDRCMARPYWEEDILKMNLIEYDGGRNNDILYFIHKRKLCECFATIEAAAVTYDLEQYAREQQ